MDTVNADRGEVSSLPKLSFKRIFSTIGFLRIAQLSMCIATYVCVNISPICIDMQIGDDVINWYCIGPNLVVFRIYMASIVFTFLTTLLVFLIDIANMTDVIKPFSWNKLVFIHTQICMVLLIFVSILYAKDKFTTTTTTVGMVLGLLTWGLYLFHFYFQYLEIGDNTDLEGQGVSEVSAESNDEDDLENAREIPTLSIVRQRVSSLESINDNTVWPVISEGVAALSFHRPSSAVSSNDSEDPRSWVISGDPGDDDEEDNAVVSIIEDTMSTDTYTVDTNSDIQPPIRPKV